MIKDTRFIEGIKWLWDNRDKSLVFASSVLTEANRASDSSTINPPLTGVESVNLFQFLERKDLLYKQAEGIYVINKIEEYKWKVLLADLKRWDWTRHWFWTAWHKIFAVVFIALISGWIAAVATKWTENKLSTSKQELKTNLPQPAAQQPAPNNQSQNNTKSDPVIPNAPPINTTPQ